MCCVSYVSARVCHLVAVVFVLQNCLGRALFVYICLLLTFGTREWRENALLLRLLALLSALLKLGCGGASSTFPPLYLQE